MTEIFISRRHELIKTLNEHDMRVVSTWAIDLVRGLGSLIVNPSLRKAYLAICDVTSAALELPRLPEKFAEGLDIVAYSWMDEGETMVDVILADDHLLASTLEATGNVLSALRDDQHKVAWPKAVNRALDEYESAFARFVQYVADDIEERVMHGLERAIKLMIDGEGAKAKALLDRESKVWLMDLDKQRSRHRAFIRSQFKDEPYYAYSIREWDRLGLS